MGNTLQDVFDRAWHDPAFFLELVRNPGDLAPVLETNGLSLSEEAIEELEELLDNPTLPIKWSALEEAFGSGVAPGFVAWDDLFVAGWSDWLIPDDSAD